MKTHEEKIKDLCGQLTAYRGGEPVSLLKDGISHSVPKPRDSEKNDNKIYVGKLDEILNIDAENRICAAEPGVTFDKLAGETLKHGLAPMLVPELKDITIGGAVSGCSVESMSYKYGGFHDNCLEYEVVTPEGEILVCNREQNTDIFHMIHGSFGTLGIITKLTFKLIPAKPFVCLTHETYDNAHDYLSAIRLYQQSGQHDFIDGIVHSDSEFVLCLGQFVDEAPYISEYGLKGPYYKSTRKLGLDYMRTYDYFFRYDSDCHWIARGFGLENKILRPVFGKWFLGSTQLIKWAKRLGFLFKGKKPDVVIDVFIPASRFQEFYEFYVRKFNYYPLWIVPYRLPHKYPWVNPEFWKDMDDELVIDCAIYGMKQGDKDYYKLLEKELIRLKGIKTLISYNSYDEETFWKIFNKQEYFKIKKRLDPNGKLRDLYAKTHQK